jgi:uncharacterized protein
MSWWFLLAGLLAAGSSGAAAASFDCGKARTADEKTVCGDVGLSALDGVVGRAFAGAMQQPNPDDQRQVRSVARTFLVDRRACGANTRCILVRYLDVLGYYMRFVDRVALPDWVTAPFLADGRPLSDSAVPDVLGACARTAVREVGGRLAAGDFDSGVSISYTNQVIQVSYEREDKVVASRPWDRVVMCLVSLPRFCPAGDARGKIYLVTNLRTGGTWWLPDSQHTCGGA